MSSRRRKAAVTKRVIEEDTGDSGSLMDTDTENTAPTPTRRSARNESARNESTRNESTRNEATENGTGIPEDLPEGTVIVQPEAVDSSADFSEPEFKPRKGKKHDTRVTELDLNQQNCTACKNQLLNPRHFKRHPALKVLICKKCSDWYSGDVFDQDSNGIDEQCRWCGDGGNLLCCDHCTNAFCKACIRSNLGRTELSTIMDADEDDQWKCYVCNPLPLASLIAHCTAILKKAAEVIEKRKDQEKREKEKREKEKREKEKRRSKDQSKRYETPPIQSRASQRDDERSGTTQKDVEGKGSVWEMDYAEAELEKKVDQLFEWQKKFAMALTSFRKQIGGLKDFDRSNPHEMKRLKDRKKSIVTDLVAVSRRVGKELSTVDVCQEKVRKTTSRPNVQSTALRSLLTGGGDQPRTSRVTAQLPLTAPSEKSKASGGTSKKPMEAIVIDDDDVEFESLDNLTFEDMTRISQKKQNEVIRKLGKMTKMDEEEEKDKEKVKDKKKKETEKGTKSVEKKKEEPKVVKPFVPARKRKVSESAKDATPSKVKKKLFGNRDDKSDSGSETEGSDSGKKKDAKNTKGESVDNGKAQGDKKDESGGDEAMDIDGVAEEDEDDSGPELDPVSGEMKSQDKSEKGQDSSAKETSSKSNDKERSEEQSDSSKKSDKKGKSDVDESDGDEDRNTTNDHNKSKKSNKNGGSDVDKDEESISRKDRATSKKSDKEGEKKSDEGEDGDSLDEQEMDEMDKTNEEKSGENGESDNIGKEAGKKEGMDKKGKGAEKKGKELSKKHDELGSESGTSEKDISLVKSRRSKSQKDNQGTATDKKRSEKKDKTRNGKKKDKSESQTDNEEESHDSDRTVEKSLDKEKPDKSSDAKKKSKSKSETEDEEKSDNESESEKTVKKSSETEKSDKSVVKKKKSKSKSETEDEEKSDNESESESEKTVKKSSEKEKSDKSVVKKKKSKSKSDTEDEEKSDKESESEKTVQKSSEKEKSDKRSVVKKKSKSKSETEDEKKSDNESESEKNVAKGSKGNSGDGKKGAKKDSKKDKIGSSSKRTSASGKENSESTEFDLSGSEDDKNKRKRKTRKVRENSGDGKRDTKKDKTGSSSKRTSVSGKDDSESTEFDWSGSGDDKKKRKRKTGKVRENSGDGKKEAKKDSKKDKIGSSRKRTLVSGEEDSESTEFDWSGSDDDKKTRKRKTRKVRSAAAKQAKDKATSGDKVGDVGTGDEKEDENEKARIALLEMISGDSSDSESEITQKGMKKKKKISPKGRVRHSQYQSSTEEDTDEERKSKSKTSPGRHRSGKTSHSARKKTEKLKHESASSNYDSDLEKEIDKLSSKPRKSRRKMRTRDSSDSDTEVDRNVKRKEKKDKKPAIANNKKKDKKTEKDDDATSSSESENEEEESDMDQDAESDTPPAMNGGIEMDVEDDENEAARKQLLAEVAESDDDDSDDSDVESGDSGTKKKKKKSQSKKKSGSDDEESDSENPKKNKHRTRSKLERAKIDDSEGSSAAFESLIKEGKKNGKDSKKSRRKRLGSDEEDWKSGSNVDESASESSPDASPDDSSANSDSDSDVVRKSARRPLKGKRKRGKKTSSDSSDANKKKKRRRIKKVKNSSCEDSDQEAEAAEAKKNRKKKKKGEEESAEEQVEEDGEEGEDGETPSKGRKKIRKIVKEKKLEDATIAAATAERDRRERVQERQELYNNVMIETEADDSSPTKCPITTKLVLEINKETKEPLVEVNKKLIRLLKPHQVEGVKFLWDCVVESVEEHKKSGGSGCILAHCMGLGKTLSVITFIHTLLNYGEILKLRTVLVICPLNTVLNWETEWDKWFDDDEDKFEVYELGHVKNNQQRAQMVKDWQESGGILIIGYEMFRNLCKGNHMRNKRLKKTFFECLSDPGPDIVVCDEGHILKNDLSALSKTCNNISTKRRIVLTGTPLQNNLIEYHCMVNFVKRNLLGTKKEFSNRFINPITNGQCADSTQRDVRIMKKRSHVLHEMLDGCVQRKDYGCLAKFLPPKFEYVISVRLSPGQVDLYRKYMDLNVTFDENGKRAGASLFKDYQNLMRIWTHPWVLKMHQDRLDEKAMMNDDSDELDDFLDDEDSDDSEASLSASSKSKSDSDVITLDSDEDKKKKASTSRSRRGDAGDEIVNKWKSSTRGGNSRSETPLQQLEDVVKNESDEWWGEHVNLEDDQWKYKLSGKLVVLFEIIRLAEEVGDKVLVFSQSILSLNIIEEYLDYFDRSSEHVCGPGGWSHGIDYFRLDGTTNAQHRKKYAEVFNDIEDDRARLFLISTRAGSLGINLVAGNRVVIFDASWNPSYDTQSMFRVYRFGQLKPCYIYRFLAQGTMEEKIYERQVTKQSLSQRVVDEHQVERHFSAADMRELYAFTPDPYDAEAEQPTPILPKDRFLADILVTNKEWILKYHHHDSLLENLDTEKLSEEDRKTAWEEYEAEKKGQFTYYNAPNTGMDQQSYNLLAQGNNLLQQGQQSMETLQAYLQNPTYINNMMRMILQQNPTLTPIEVTQRLQMVINMQMQQHSSQIRAQQELHKQQIQARQQQELLRLQQIQQQRRLHEDRIRQREWLTRLQNEATSEPKIVEIADDDS